MGITLVVLRPQDCGLSNFHVMTPGSRVRPRAPCLHTLRTKRSALRRLAPFRDGQGSSAILAAKSNRPAWRLRPHFLCSLLSLGLWPVYVPFSVLCVTPEAYRAAVGRCLFSVAPASALSYREPLVSKAAEANYPSPPRLIFSEINLSRSRIADFQITSH